VSDNRIPAYGSDVSRYTFVASQTGSAVKVTARLIFRRLFQATAKAKGWDAPDIVMAEAETRLNLSQ
jgi:hypothetical protein